MQNVKQRRTIMFPLTHMGFGSRNKWRQEEDTGHEVMPEAQLRCGELGPRGPDCWPCWQMVSRLSLVLSEEGKKKRGMAMRLK